jgi:hypothetical protein
MKNAVFWILRPVALVKTDVSEECNSPFLVNLIMEAIRSSEMSVLTRATLRIIPLDGILHQKLFLSLIEQTVFDF